MAQQIKNNRILSLVLGTRENSCIEGLAAVTLALLGQDERQRQEAGELDHTRNSASHKKL